ncbi:2'-5' RNA ligase family protein [Chitinophaga polysaccharea]|uniref:2'-5' RNA ligase family protein n=1 Tax=Chitinophaga polysaccharea TaxID=1293035 RepID=UPI00115B7979|nr:2'-5' RNA ligase family protein [Chitinophaga polysaccharea]
MASYILTLQLDPESMGFFNRLRRQYYPAHANEVAAHLSLFYRLPADEPGIIASLDTMPAQPSFVMQVNEVQRYTNGIAYTLMSEELQILHASLQSQWEQWLIPRDRQPLRPHITIMNQVTAFKAQQAHEVLKSVFLPFEVTATGIQLWRYLKGPWKLERTYGFFT